MISFGVKMRRMIKRIERTSGNIGEKNLARLQTVKGRLLQEHRATAVDRVADRISRNYEAFLLNDDEFPEIARILREQRKTPSDVGKREYFLGCAQMIIDQGLLHDETDFPLDTF